MSKVTEKKNTSHRVSVFRDTYLTYPELWLEVAIIGPYGEAAPFPEFFARARCSKADSVDKADLVVFVGGEDVNPALYGAEAHPLTDYDYARDKEDIAVFTKCYREGIPMFGVCRGAQFGHVMLGGKLYQHVDGHTGDHSMMDRRANRVISKVSSVHHQMVMSNVNGGMEVIGDTFKSSIRAIDKVATDSTAAHPDIEAFFYRDACFFGVQGHPEYRGYPEFAKWTLDSIGALIVENPDIESRGGNYRLKKEVLETRKDLLISEDVWKELA